MDKAVRVTSRTPVGKHCWYFTGERTVRHQMNCVNDWLWKLALRPKKMALEMTGIKGDLEDPFDVSFINLPVNCLIRCVLYFIVHYRFHSGRRFIQILFRSCRSYREHCKRILLNLTKCISLFNRISA